MNLHRRAEANRLSDKHIMPKKLHMKNLFILIATALLLGSQVLTAQNKGLDFDLNGGIASPQIPFVKDTALMSSGTQINGGLNYLGKQFGLGINTGYTKNPLDPSAIQQLASLPSGKDLQFTRQHWESLYGAVGPVFRLGATDLLDWQLSSQLGLQRVQLPTLGKITKANSASQNQLISGIGNDPVWQGFWSVGTRLKFQLSRRLGLSLHASYRANLQEPRLSPDQIATQLQAMGVRKDLRSVQDLVLRIGQQKRNLLNLGAGISYQFGNQDQKQEKAEAVCENSVPLSPADGAIFLLDGAQRPTFNWTNGTPKEVKYYHFQLFDGDRQVFELKTDKNELPHQEALEAIYKKGADAEKRYAWQITTYFGACEPLVSNRVYFTMSNRSGVFHDIFDLECNAPAFTNQGDLRLTGKISFFNNISASDPLIINSFSDVIIQDASGTPLPGVVLTNITDCVSTLPIPLPLSIAPGSTETYCFELIVPAGHTAIRSEAHGTINGLPQMSTDQDDLPQCSCTVCDNWQFSGKTSTLNYASYGGNFFNAMVFQDIQIANAAPIKEVKAEIVYVEHVANDPQCYTCTKHDNDMGLMSFHPTKPMVLLTNGNWKNNKFGYKGPGDAYDTDNDNYVNQVIWKASDPVNGIDFNNYSHRFRIPINLPQPSSLSCCDHRYEVCVRYTFTDVNCATCDYLVCYRMSPKQSSGGGLGTGGLGTGTGVDLGDLDIDRTVPLPGNGGN